ncbi:hypothetical protein G6F58_013384 [Rhizopus delemar]|nr:hypothetical protein G6F58_013384 [Rhizopus delemar]
MPRGAMRAGSGLHALQALGDEGLDVEGLGGVGHARWFREWEVGMIGQIRRPDAARRKPRWDDRSAAHRR